jgi:hypothetical protein
VECFYTIADGFLWLELKYLKCKVIFSLSNFAWFLQSLSGEQGVFVPLNLTKGHSKKRGVTTARVCDVSCHAVSCKKGAIRNSCTTLAQTWLSRAGEFAEAVAPGQALAQTCYPKHSFQYFRLDTMKTIASCTNYVAPPDPVPVSGRGGQAPWADL